jgi:hypothetical protein
MAGILPGTGKDPLLLSKQPDAHGVYPVAFARTRGREVSVRQRLTPAQVLWVAEAPRRMTE